MGVLGGGQLARMMALAGHPLGITCTVLDPAAGRLRRRGGRADRGRLRLGRRARPAGAASDVVTFEFESVPAASAERLAGRVAVLPPPGRWRSAQDRLAEKRLFARAGHRDGAVPRRSARRPSWTRGPLPGVLKTRRLGYDGKGQRVLRDAGDAGGRVRGAGGGAADPGGSGRVRPRAVDRGRARGATATSPAIRWSRTTIARASCGSRHAPAPEAGAALQELAERYARLVLERLEYVGVLALELFQVGDRLLANEMAPRVHNSGHWTIEGAETSQFENHLRAVCGLPLGSTALADAVHDGEPDRRSACDRRAGRRSSARTCTCTARRRAPAARSGTSRSRAAATGRPPPRLPMLSRRCACRGASGGAGHSRECAPTAAAPEPDLRRPTPARCQRRR